MKNVVKFVGAMALGAAATAMLSEGTRKDISKAADGVTKDVKAKAKKVGDAVAKFVKEEVLGEKPQGPKDPPTASA